MSERQTLITLIIGVIFHTELYGNAMSIFGKGKQILKYLLFNPFFDLLTILTNSLIGICRKNV
jgi:hypothetical protein